MYKIRVKLSSYDHRLVDRSAEQIVKVMKEKKALVSGPIPLPTEKKIVTVLRSPHVHKDSREQFQVSIHKRLIDVYNVTQEIVTALAEQDLPKGVDIKVKTELIGADKAGKKEEEE